MAQVIQTQVDREVVITRSFDAPRELVFRAWSQPGHMQNWHTPHGCSIKFHQFDFRVGGVFQSELTTPDGQGCQCLGTYLEISAPERIVYKLGFCDEAGNALETTPFDKDWPIETVVTVTFDEADGKTQMTLHQNVSEAVAKRTGAYPSWLEMFDRLDEELLHV